MFTDDADVGAFLVSAMIWLVGTGITLGLAYVVIKAAVLHALREHTVTSNMGVVIVKSVPLNIADAPGEAPAAPAAG